MDPYIKILENQYYHIYNRGNNRENIFYKKDNYNYFLRKYDYYLSDYLETFAYCLLPNHFHLLVRVKPYSAFPQKDKGQRFIDSESRVSEQFRLLFMSYAKAINIQEDRVGSLFQKNFRRKLVDNDRYLSNLVYYIHSNPQLHGINEDFKNYPHSSYGRMLIDKPSKLLKGETLQWFGNKEGYEIFHSQKHVLNDMQDYLIED